MFQSKINTKEQKLFQDISDTNDVSDDCSDEKNSSSFRPSLRCPDCCLLPFLTLKENSFKVIINCSDGHNNELPLNEYLEKGFQKNINDVKCSECGHELEPKTKFKFCSECIQIFCKKCLKKHNKNKETSNHIAISLRKMDTFCCFHRHRYSHYCEDCHKNLCKKCLYLHYDHQLLSLKDLKLTKNEFKEIRERLNKEEAIINDIVLMFNKAIESIRQKFEEVIQNKKQVIEFKKIIEDLYEIKDSSLQIIENVRRLQFNDNFAHFDSDMNELDIIFEIFNYLNCIDYNVGNHNSFINMNKNKDENLNKNNNIIEESLSNITKEIMDKNLVFDKKNISKQFIYEKKNNKQFMKYPNKNKEEEKNYENNNTIRNDAEKTFSTNELSLSMKSKNEKMNSLGFENIVNNNNNMNKTQKYSKKIIQERINKKTNEKKNRNLIIKRRLKNLSNDSEGVPVLSECNQINNIEKVDDNNIDDIIEDFQSNNLLEDIFQSNKSKKKNIFKTNKIYKSPEPIITENDNKSIDSNSIENNINNFIELNNNKNKNNLQTINENEKEVSIISISSYENEKLKVKKRKKKKGIVKAKSKDILTKVKIKDKSLDNILDREVRDKPKEKTARVKSNEQLNIFEKINLNYHHNNFKSFDEYQLNSFEFPSILNQKKNINQSNIEQSFFSERQGKKGQNNDFNEKNKLANRNYHQKNNSYQPIEKKNEIKQYISRPPFLNLIRIRKENQKSNNIFYEMSDDFTSKDISGDNTSNDNVSNDNKSNDVTSDDVSYDINGIPKIKKKRKKAVKKKKKIRKINIIGDCSDENENNQNNMFENNSKNNKEESENILKKQKIIKKSIIKRFPYGIDNNQKEKLEEMPKIMNITPIGEEYPVKEEEKYQTPLGKNDKNSSNNKITPTPSPPLNILHQQIDNQNSDKINNPKERKQTKKNKRTKKMKVDLSKSFDEMANSKKMNKKKLSLNENIGKAKRSNSLHVLKPIVPETETPTKIKTMSFENGINCLLDLSKQIFCAGNLIGDIKVIEKKAYKEIQTIKEHNGTINSLFKLSDGAMLSSSADKLMKKIRLTKNYLYYDIEFVFDGYFNYVFKGIELFNGKIISCSWDDKLYLWEDENSNQYQNSLKFNENQRVEDILEISRDKFASVSECELKIWNSNNMAQLHSIKLKKGIVTPNSLCKINNEILISIFYHAIHLIDLNNYSLIKTISMDQSNLSCIMKLNDGSILIAEDANTDEDSIFYLKQYILEGDELQYISYKKDKYSKSNKNDYKEIRALIQFSDGIISQGISGELNGKDSGDIFFYQ